MRENARWSRRTFLVHAVTVAAATATAPLLSRTAHAASAGYPIKGKTISLIVPWPPGGPADASARILSPVLEETLGLHIEIINRGGAGTQLGMNELVRSRADGYTLGQVSLPTLPAVYFNPERQAVFARKSFQPISMYLNDPGALAVRSDSPYNDLKSLLDAAKANPGKLKVGATGVLTMAHLLVLLLQKASGAKFSVVQFDGGGPGLIALLGGHIDCLSGVLSDVVVRHKGGQVRALVVAGKEPSPFLPDVKTAEAQGYNIYPLGSSRGWAGPAGTPKEVVEKFDAAVKRAVEDSGVKQKMEAAGLALYYMPTEAYAANWAEVDGIVRQLFEEEGIKVPTP